MKKKIYTMALMPLLIAVSSITVLAASSDGEPQPSDLSNLPIPAPYYGEAPQVLLIHIFRQNMNS